MSNPALISRTDLTVDGESESGGIQLSGSGFAVNIGDTPGATAVLELSSTTRGFLPPRMTTTERNAITADEGLVIYNLTTGQLETWDGGAWLAGSADSLLASNNLSDLVSASTARSSLGLATVAASGSASDLSSGTLPVGRMPALTGDVTTSSGAVATTLATVNSNVGSFGDGTHVAAITVNAKGLVTAVSSTLITVSGSLVLLEQHTASSSASLDFTACITGTYDEYMIEAVNVIPASAAASLQLRMSTDGGSSYDSGNNYGWGTLEWSSSGSGTSGTSPTSGIVIARNLATTANYSVNGSWKLMNPGGALYKQVIGAASVLTGSNIEGQHSSGVYRSTTAVNAFQALMSSGNISSGTIRVYGLAK